MVDLYFPSSVVPAAVAAAAVAIPTYFFVARACERYFVRQCTATVDLESVGAQRVGGKLPGTVVICGASFAGLMAARVCSDHFARVVVVEPEAWALSDDARTGQLTTGTRTVRSESGVEYQALIGKRTRIWQYFAGHIYQVFFLRFLRKLFLEFDTKAKARGHIIGPADVRARANGVQVGSVYAEYAARGEDIPEAIFGTRYALESLLCALVHEARPSIEYINGTAAGFVLAPTGPRRVASVSIRLPDGTTLEVPCDMVVDCSGNAQVGLKLLGRILDLSPSIRVSYNPQMTLCGINVPVPPGFDDALESMRASFMHPLCKSPARKLGMYMSWVVDPDVDHRTLVILRTEAGVFFCPYGWASETVVTLDQVREYSSKLVGECPPPAIVSKILDLLEPVADQSTASELHLNSCSRVFYEKSSNILPHNFVAIGDATMRLNPRFGEGVTKAAVGAATLDGVLRDYRDGPSDRAFGRTFFKRLANRTSSLWDVSKAIDYGAKTTTPVPGETRADGAFYRWYMRRLLRATAYNARLASAFWHVNNFIAPAGLLSSPRAILTVLWHTAFPAPPI